MEPRLKYHRVGQSNKDLMQILEKDYVTCLAVHSKFICVGTNWGSIYILDHMGNNIHGSSLPGHSTTVNHLSIDEKGEFLASCAMDERVIINNIFNKKTHSTLKLDKPIFSVAISANFGATQSYVTGDDRLILVEPGFIKKQHRVLFEGKVGSPVRPIRSIVWTNSLVAWSTEDGVKAYCLTEKRILTSVPRPATETDKIAAFIQATDESNFIAAFRHSVFVCCISADRISGRRIGQIVSSFTFPLAVCGICAFGTELLLLSHRDREKPQLHLVEPGKDTYVELAIEELKVRGFERYVAANYRFEHLRSEGMYFIVCPKDIICAQQRDRGDHMQWLLQRGKFKLALDEVKERGLIGQYTVASVGRRYIESLLESGKLAEAAEVCSSVITGKEDWEDMVERFHRVGSARSLADYLPRCKPKLDSSWYDIVLNEVFLTDPEQFLKLISTWPSDLFNVGAITKVVVEALCMRPNDNTMNRCLARLYELQGAHEKTLSILLKLGSADTFQLVGKHRLYACVVDKLPLLFSIDKERTLQMLLDDQSGISVGQIVTELSASSGLLCDYLDAVYSKDPSRVEKHYDKMIELYAVHARPKLLPFLRSAPGFKYEHALALCVDKNFIPETVYILARMGRRKEALDILLHEEQYEWVVQFCRDEADPELWMAAADAASNRPNLITALLHNSGSEVDPSILIHKIRPGVQVPHLRDSIVKLLSDYRMGAALTQGCATIQSLDSESLIHRQVKSARRALPVNPAKDVCVRCRAPLLVAKRSGGAGDSPAEHTLLFNCGHYFHAECRAACSGDVGAECPACAGICY